MSIRRLTSLVALVVALHAGIAAADLSSTVNFNIEPQPLSAALLKYSQQSRIQVTSPSELLDGRASVGVIGALSAQEALARLLEGTKLSYDVVDGNTVSIRGAQAQGRDKVSVQAADAQPLVLAEGGSVTSAAGNPQNSAAATDTADQGAREAGQEVKLQEIIVTARKTSERLQDIPVTVTALSGGQLQDLGAVDVKDVLRSVPGLSFSNVERGQAKYTIHGIASNTAFPTVGVYLDDISLNSAAGVFSGAFDPIFFDIERLEILKGPQGTLYGGSAMGGAIKYVSARPNLSSLSSSVAAGVATTAHGAESYNAEGILNLPIISDVLAVRGGVSYRHEGGYIDNIANLPFENTAFSSTAFPVYTPLVRPSLATQSEKDYNDGEVYVARLSLLWRPDPSWSIRPAALYQDSKLNNSSYILPGQSGLVSSYRFNSQPTHDVTGIYSLDMNKTLGEVELTSLTSYVDRKLSWDRDYSFFIGGLVPALFPANSFAHIPFHFKTLSQELRVASAAGSDSRLHWLAGLYYSDYDEDFNSRIDTAGLGAAAYVDTVTKRTDKAAFAESTYRITENFDVTAGVRLFQVDQKIDSAGSGALTGNSALHRQIDQDGVNPKVGLSYKIDADHLLYTSAAKGFRPGGVSNANAFPNCVGELQRLGFAVAPDSFESDNLWTYELGSKNEFGGKGFALNGALFYSDWKQIQQNIRLPGCGQAFVINAGDARVQGVELESRINLARGFQVGGNATYTDAKIVETAGIAKKGDEVQDVPEWMGSAYGSYSIPVLNSWDLRFRADYQYRSKQRRVFDFTQRVAYPVNGAYPTGGPSSLIPLGATIQDGYEVTNAAVFLEKERTSLRLFVNNVFDVQPEIDTTVTVGITRTTTITPRTIGLEVRKQF